VGGDYRGGIRHQIGVPWKGAPQEIRSDYLQARSVDTPGQQRESPTGGLQ